MLGEEAERGHMCTYACMELNVCAQRIMCDIQGLEDGLTQLPHVRTLLGEIATHLNCTQKGTIVRMQKRVMLNITEYDQDL